MIPTTTQTSQAKYAKGDGPATQATRLACTLNDVVYADGCELYSRSKQTQADDNLLWTSKHSIQSVTAMDNKLAAVNSLGHVWINGQELASCSNSSDESGWCGLALGTANTLAVARMWEHDTMVLDLETGNVISRFHHAQPPIALCASPSKPNVFFACEWNMATVWDSRARIPLIETLSGNQLGGGGNGPLWAIDASESSFCVGGEDRIVSSMDDRKWRSFDLWKTPLKHDIVGVSFVPNTRLVALGLDHEIAQCVEKHSHRLHDNHRVFRTRARWSGVCNIGDELWARDAQGTLYCFQTM